MYLSPGGSTAIPYEEIVGIFDLDHVSASHRSREFLRRREEEGALHALGRRIPVSLVVADRGCYLSPVSSTALARRVAEDRWE